MKIRPKLSELPMSYTLAQVDGTTDSYMAFGKALWADDGATSGRLKELVFIRSSIVNQCPT